VLLLGTLYAILLRIQPAAPCLPSLTSAVYSPQGLAGLMITAFPATYTGRYLRRYPPPARVTTAHTLAHDNCFT